jgi:hypothetical protein
MIGIRAWTRATGTTFPAQFSTRARTAGVKKCSESWTFVRRSMTNSTALPLAQFLARRTTFLLLITLLCISSRIPEKPWCITWPVIFQKTPCTLNLEFWGVMQAINIQQDAISELHRAIVGNVPTTQSNSAWCRLRDTRHRCAGHPARRSHGVPATQRTFMGRSFGKYDHISYELWDAGTKQRTHPTFNLRHMVDDYDKEASRILCDVLTSMKSKWP